MTLGIIQSAEDLPINPSVQCPVCSQRYELSRLPPGKRAKCTCNFRFAIPDPATLTRLPLLSLTLPKIGLTAVVEDVPEVQQEKAQTKETDREHLEQEVASIEAKHPILSDLDSRKFIPMRLFSLREQAEQLALVSGFDQLMCLSLLKGVDSYEYQERTVRHVLRELGGRALLADEVGLGKTIEAGMILKELVVRGLVRKILILTPASLVTQWKDELSAKFHLSFQIGKEAGDWSNLPRVVTSIDTAKSAKNMSEIHSIKWDLIIVDESHRLKDKKTLNWKLVNGIHKRYILLLSATPFQNDLLELFNLITILRPGQLYTEREFREKFLKRGNPRQARDPDQLKTLLRQVMVRNRRGEVGVRFTQRIAETKHLDMLEPERMLYDAAVQFCRNYFGDLYGGAAGLVAIGYLKQLGSSTFSFRESLVKNVLPRAQATNSQKIIKEAESLLNLADSVTDNIKLEALVREIKSNEDRVIVFTQYRGTQDYIAARFKTESLPHALFHGGLSADEKDLAVGRFRRDARILLCTESGGEGRNLQFANRLVNYDLPWNPMRVEQRIGRIHRMGQTRDVFIISLACRNTIEDYLLSLLEHKLNLFRLVVGEVDGILGKLRLDEQIVKLFLKSRDDAEFKKHLTEFGEELEAMRSKYEQFKKTNDNLLGAIDLGDAA